MILATLTTVTISTPNVNQTIRSSWQHVYILWMIVQCRGDAFVSFEHLHYISLQHIVNVNFAVFWSSNSVSVCIGQYRINLVFLVLVALESNLYRVLHFLHPRMKLHFTYSFNSLPLLLSISRTVSSKVLTSMQFLSLDNLADVMAGPM